MGDCKDMETRLRRVEDGMIKLETTLEQVGHELKRVNDNLVVLTDIQKAQVQHREETKNMFEKAYGVATRAHERIDKIEGVLTKVNWTILTIIIAGVVTAAAKVIAA